MIAVVSTGPLTGRYKSIYDRILRYTADPAQYQHFWDIEEIPAEFKTIILMDDFDGYLTRKWLGRNIPIYKARGYRFPLDDGRTVVPTFSPAILNGRMNYMPVAIWDFRQALKFDRMAPPVFPMDGLVLFPNPTEFRDLCEQAAKCDVASFDLETPGKSEKDDDSDQDFVTTITRASFAFKTPDDKITAVTFPWIEPYISIVRDYFLMANVPKVFWNGWGFDIPVLRENKIDPAGRTVDAMWLYHFLQPTLPKSLGAVSTLYDYIPEWKSLNNENPELYSAMDARQQLQNYYGIKAALERRGVWALADRHVTELLHLLDEMHLKGVNVKQTCESACPDEGECCLKNFNATCDVKLTALKARFNEHPELKDLRPFHPKQGYKRTPIKKCSECEGNGYLMPDGMHEEPCPPCGSSGRVANTDALEQVTFVVSCHECDGKGFQGVISKEFDGPCPYCGGSGETSVKRWVKREDFLPTSQPQVESYFDLKGYTYENTDEKTLTSLARKHDDNLLLEFIEYREQVKSKGTYGGIPIGPDGRVHTTFTLRPDTHRLSSIRPNLQNQPADFKHVYIPSPGCTLVEVDLSSVEAVITGFFAGDEEYIRRARIGIHKIAMAVYLGEQLDFNWADAKIKALVKDIGDRDKQLYRKIKAVIYGGNYLAGKRTIHRTNPGSFANEAEAGKFLRFCQSLSPKIPAWQRRTVEQAQREHGLTNPFGYYKALWSHEDGPAACAFLPQSTVAAIMKEIMLDLIPELRKYLVLQVHDSLVFDIPNERLKEMIPEIHKAFDRSWPQLNGLKIGYEMKQGNTLAFH